VERPCRALAAEFYVALDTATNGCHVVTERPDDRPTVLKDGQLAFFEDGGQRRLPE
jgi:hypothetical protein